MTSIQFTAAKQAADVDILYFDLEYFSQKIQDTLCIAGKGATKL
jgi:hypothetical protein